VGEFSFDAEITKAYERDGRMHVLAVPSDTFRDDQGDRISKGGLGRLADQCKNGIDILDNHRATFPFGRTTGETHVRDVGGGSQLVVDVELDETYPQSLALFKEVQAGICKKQLSIGGKLNRDNPDCIRYEKSDDGARTRVIDDLILDHIACTRKDKAANKRTSFLDAVLKAVGEVESAREDIEKEGGRPMPGTETAAVEKKAVPFKQYPMYEGKGWAWGATQGNALIEEGGWPMFKEAHAWYNDKEGAAPENKAAYKLPHHVLEGGQLVTHWPGVSYAMAALLGARGGTAIPAGEKRATYDHLAQHYADAKRTPPEFRMAAKVTTKKGETVEAKEFKGGLENVDFEKTEFTPWGREDFVKFHADQKIGMDWMTEKVWTAATNELSEEAHKQAEADWTKEKNEMEKAKEEAKAGFNFLRKIGAALGFGGSEQEKTEELELSEVVKGIVSSVQELEADAEKSAISEVDQGAMARVIGLIECAVAKIAKAAEVAPTLTMTVENPKVKVVADKADGLLDLADVQFSEDDAKALAKIHAALRAMKKGKAAQTEPEGAAKTTAKADDKGKDDKGKDDKKDDKGESKVSKEIPADMFSTIVEKAMLVHEQLLAEKLEAMKAIVNDIAANAATMKPEDLRAKVNNLSDISWNIKDMASMVNATKSAMHDVKVAGSEGGDTEKAKKVAADEKGEKKDEKKDGEKKDDKGTDKGTPEDAILKALEESVSSTVKWLTGLEKEKAKGYAARVQAVVKSLTDLLPKEEGKEAGKDAGKGSDGKDAGGKKGDDAAKSMTDKGSEISKDLLEGEIKKTKGEVSKEIEDVVKKTKDDLSKEIEDKVVGAIGEVKKAFDGMSQRLERIEKVSGVPQGIAGTDDVNKGTKKKGDMWTGLFDKAITKANSKM
jgi:hypothetical protein